MRRQVVQVFFWKVELIIIFQLILAHRRISNTGQTYQIPAIQELPSISSASPSGDFDYTREPIREVYSEKYFAPACQQFHIYECYVADRNLLLCKVTKKSNWFIFFCKEDFKTIFYLLI